MASKISDLQNELDALQSQINGISIPYLTEQHAAARHRLDTTPQTKSLQIDPQHREAEVAFGLAHSALYDAKNRLRDLERQAQPLRTMLSAPKRVQDTLADLENWTNRKAVAGRDVGKCLLMQDDLVAQIAEAQQQFDADVSANAQAVLQAAREGKTIKVGTPDKSQLHALENAHAILTVHDLAQANVEEAKVCGEYVNAMVAYEQAKKDAAKLVFELQSRDYAQACIEYLKFDPTHDAGSDIGERVLILEAQAENEAPTT